MPSLPLHEFKSDLMKQMVILVGAPASGKSYFVNTTLGKWFKGGAGLTKSFPKLSFGSKKQESDNALRQLQYEAAGEDFTALQSAETRLAFNDLLKGKAFQYTSNGVVRRLASVLTWDEWLLRKNKIQNYFKGKGDPVNSYYASLRGRDSGAGEELKDLAREAFSDRVRDKIKQSGDIIVIDSAGEDIEATPFKDFFSLAKREGYIVSLVELNIPLALSLQRNEARGKSGRSVPDAQILSAYNAMVSVVKKLRGSLDVDRYVRYVWKASGDGMFDGSFVVGIDDRTRMTRKIAVLKDLRKQLAQGDISQDEYDAQKRSVISERVSDWEKYQDGENQKFATWLSNYYTQLAKFTGADAKKLPAAKKLNDILYSQDIDEYHRLNKLWRNSDAPWSVAKDTAADIKKGTRKLPDFKRRGLLHMLGLTSSEQQVSNLAEGEVALDYLTTRKGEVTVFDRVSRKEVIISGDEGKNLAQALSNADTPQSLTGLLGQYAHLLESDVVVEQGSATPSAVGSSSNRHYRHAKGRYMQSRGGGNFGGAPIDLRGRESGVGNQPPPPPPHGSGGHHQDQEWYAPDDDTTLALGNLPKGSNITINVSGDINIMNENELEVAAQVAPRLLTRLREHTRQNYISVAEAFSVSHGQAKSILSQMVREGLVTDIGGGFVSLPEVVQHELKTQPVIAVSPQQNVGRGAGQRRTPWDSGGAGGTTPGPAPGGGAGGGSGPHESTEEQLTSITFNRGQASEMLRIMNAVGLSKDTEVHVIGENFTVEVPESLATHLQETLVESPSRS
jgi:predicted kinase